MDAISRILIPQEAMLNLLDSLNIVLFKIGVDVAYFIIEIVINGSSFYAVISSFSSLSSLSLPMNGVHVSKRLIAGHHTIHHP